MSVKVMGLANDYSREDIDKTLKNHIQYMGMYFSSKCAHLFCLFVKLLIRSVKCRNFVQDLTV